LRSWSLEAARAILGEVRGRTQAAVEEVEALSASRDRLAAEAPERAEIDARIRSAVSRDFDNGQGYYCWRWPEESLEHYHGYDEGFAGRIRIQ
jgi:hypothetical protein